MVRSLAACLAALSILAIDAPAQSPFGNALRLYGDTAWVDVGDHPQLNFGANQDFTIEAWFKTATSANQRILYKASLQTTSGYGIFVDQGGVRGAAFSPGIGGSVLVPSPLGYDDGQFHHVAFIREGSMLKIMVDGQVADTREVPNASLDNPGSLTIGADAINGGRVFFDGWIDEVRIWDVARPEADIRDTMTDTLYPVIYTSENSHLVSYFRFDRLEDLGIGSEGANDFRDLSFFGAHGDLVGTGDLTPTLDDDFSKPRLTLQFLGMSPHVGQAFGVRVVDRASGLEVARHRMKKIQSPDFEIWLDALIGGHSYDVDFYADHNGSGFYDAPPLDHAWRLGLGPSVGDDTLTFVHNTDFTDIGWTPFLDFLQYEAIWRGFTLYADSRRLTEVVARMKIDLANQTIEISAQNESSVLFDTLRVLLSGDVTADGDSAYVSPAEASSGKSGLSFSFSGLSYTLDDRVLSGGVTITNSGRAEGQLAFDVAGMGVDFAIEGTLGRHQAILNMKSDFMGIDATTLIREDSVISKSATSTRLELPSATVGLLVHTYPNPSNDAMMFEIEHPTAGRLQLVVFDVLGRKLKTVYDDDASAGTLQLPFDGSDLTPGVYPYRVVATSPAGRPTVSSGFLTIAK